MIDFPQPLYLPLENSLNPEFVSWITIATQTIVGLFGLFQLLQISISTKYGPHEIKYFFGSSFRATSSGNFQQLRLLLVAVQVVLLACLTGVNFFGGSPSTVALLLTTAATGLVFFPLQVYEPTRSVTQLGSTLLFWLVSVVWISVSTVQDLFSAHSILSTGGVLGLALEVFLLVNTWSIYLLQVKFWKPTQELLDYYALNSWSIESSSNLFSILTISWIDPIIDKVYRTNEIEASELPFLAPSFVGARESLELLKKYWVEQVNYARHGAKGENVPDSKLSVSLFFPLLKLHWFSILCVGAFDFIQTVLSFSNPFLLRWLIRFFSDKTQGGIQSDSSPPIIIGYWIATLLYLVSMFNAFLLNQLYFLENNLEYSYSAALTTLVYNKALKLSPASRKEKSVGDIVNNASTDVRVIGGFFPNLLNNLSIPFQLALCIILLHEILGKATWSGIITIAVAIPVCGSVGLLLFPLLPKLSKYDDERVSLITEVLNSIKSVKLYSWEKPMLERITEVRNEKALGTLKTVGVLMSFLMFLWGCIPFFVSVACYSAFAKINDIPLTPDIVFPALLLFDKLTEPIFSIPMVINSIASAVTSLGRIRGLLLLEESDYGVENISDLKVKQGEVSVRIVNGNFSWSKPKTTSTKDDVNGEVSGEVEEEESAQSKKIDFALSNINFTAKKGQLTCVVGRVGSGKSTLFRALLGDLPRNDEETSTVSVVGTVAYCSQSPWILNGSVKDNIMFGCKFDKDFYEKTIDACELNTDFKVLPKGDQTLVGEKGISLSGGQKARISLARAVYSKADVYLLDDVLSAVDVHVGKRIIEKVLGHKGLIMSKTVILATNSISVLHDADLIYMLNKGEIVEVGSFDECIKREKDLSDLIKEFGRKEELLTEIVTGTDIKMEEMAAIEEEVVEEIFTSKIHRVVSNETIGNASMVSNSEFHTYSLENEEGSEKGKVKFSTIIEFIKACNFGWAGVYILLTFSATFIGFLEKALLTKWSKENENANKTVDTNYYLTVYLSLGIFGAAMNLLAYFILWTLCIIRGAKYFHNKMLRSVLAAPMRFFDTTPIGRILNRFTNDILMIDLQLPMTFISFLMLICTGILTFSVVVFNLPVLIFVLIGLLVIYNGIRKYYIPCSRELKRLLSVASSPKMAHFQESIVGVDTIKAYSQEERFTKKNMQNVDNITKIQYILFACNRWLSIRLQSVSAVFVYSVSLFCLFGIGKSGQISPSLLGLIMNYSLSISTILFSIIRSWAGIETDSVAIERIAEYSNLTPEEPAGDKILVPKDWPANGEIKFIEYSTRYAEHLDNVLHEINVHIRGNEHIGIVGRTGAGKSSLTMALFRIIESTSGRIEIDGIDISKILLSDLRSKLSIIPQDSQTIKGSVRENLDPFNEYSDEKLWEVLELSHLKDHIKSMKTDPSEKSKLNVTTTETDEEREETNDAPGTKYALDAIIEDGGSNLSGGQKQLLCLARALLNQSKILLLDEATAAVDVQTDKIIQETIRKEFKDKTILIIAHRLETIIDSDRVLVLEHGKVEEFDKPDTLVKDSNGIFHLMCKESGHLTSDGKIKRI